MIKSDLILQIRQCRETHQVRGLWANLDEIWSIFYDNHTSFRHLCPALTLLSIATLRGH